MADKKLEGVISPLLTPFDDDLSVSSPLMLEHALWTLDQGAHYLSPFGTTGESVSVGNRERMHALESLVTSGVDPKRMMPGTGVCALTDTVELCRHAVQMGCAGVMVLPPFYYPHSDDGLVDYYSRLIDGVGSDQLTVCLYHIPQMSGVAITPDVTKRLNAAFPDIVTAYKDSSGNWENTKAVVDAAPDVSVFPGTENLLKDGMEYGTSGCISATMNSQPARIRAVFDALKAGDLARYDTLGSDMIEHRNAVQAAGFIPALKSMTARATGDTRWLNIRPPSDPAPASLGPELADALNWSR